jgi:hypothetical protein
VTNYYTDNQLQQHLYSLWFVIYGAVDYECNSSSEQTKDHTIVGVVDYECNSSLEQTKDHKIVVVVD